jgi:uncharacterized membrane protein
MKRNFKNFLLAALLAVVAAPFALADMDGGPDGGMHGGGMHGPGPGGMPGMDMPFMGFGQHADRIKAGLKLTPDQSAQFDAMVARSKAQFPAMKQAHEDMRAAAKAEFAKPEPDLAALAARGDAMRDKAQAAHREIRDGWLKLYATMSPEQKGMVKMMIMHRMHKMHRMMRERMHHRHHHGDHEGGSWGRDGHDNWKSRDGRGQSKDD